MVTRSGDRIGGRRRRRRQDVAVPGPAGPDPGRAGPDVAGVTGVAPHPGSTQPGLGPEQGDGAGREGRGDGDPDGEGDAGRAWLDRAWANRTGVQRAWTDRGWSDRGWSDRGWSDRAWSERMLPGLPEGPEHLRPFTRTAQVPRIEGGPAAGGGSWADAETWAGAGRVGSSPFAAADPWVTVDPWARSVRGPGHDHPFARTGVFPVVAAPRQRPRPPLGLRVAIWLVVVALVAGIAGLVVHHERPQWLKALEVGTGAAQPATSTGVPAANPPAGRSSGSGTGSARGTPSRAAPVRQVQAGFNSATEAVAASSFDVLVTTQAPCWVQVTTPASFAPVFSAVMPTGAQQLFSSANGQLTVQLGASRVAVQVRIAGKTVPFWQFTPSAVPFTINFASAPN